MVPFSHINNPFEGAVWHFTHLPCRRRELTGLLKGLISAFNTRGKFRRPQMLEIKLSAVETAGLLASHRLVVCCILTHVPPSMAPLPNPAAPLLSQQCLRASPIRNPPRSVIRQHLHSVNVFILNKTHFVPQDFPNEGTGCVYIFHL